MSFEEIEHDEEYVAALAPFLPRACPTNFDGDMERKRKKVMKNLQEWELVKDEVTGYKYYKHPYSKTKFGVIRMYFKDGSSLEVPRYERECDEPGNSGFKVVKENGRDKKIYLSELTYVYAADGRVVQNNMDDFYKSRKGKRYLKYQQYRRKRYEKKRAYLQEAANKSK